MKNRNIQTRVTFNIIIYCSAHRLSMATAQFNFSLWLLCSASIHYQLDLVELLLSNCYISVYLLFLFFVNGVQQDYHSINMPSFCHIQLISRYGSGQLTSREKTRAGRQEVKEDVKNARIEKKQSLDSEKRRRQMLCWTVYGLRDRNHERKRTIVSLTI